ncbi:hypothetical protein H9X95_30960 [Micromonospora chalcea]|uniref:hypothetical protein n=1 Tax=Micromonospora chalcea TaxID=1874 RepID=UPI001656D7CB|nr:hypothetical protein [Micromonospora chalcea]MBC8994560.1 hypothetical protein [Micromonospora chalcea]
MDRSRLLAEALDTRTTLGRTLAEAFDTRTTLGRSLAEALDTRTTLGRTLAEALDTRKMLGRTLAEAFDTRTTLGRSLAEALDTRKMLGRTLAEALNTRQVLSQVVSGLDTRTMLAQALSGLELRQQLAYSTSGPAPATSVVLDDVLADMGRTVGDQLGAEENSVALTAVWAEALQELRLWLLRPGVKAVTISFAFFLITTWWLGLKTDHPDVADAIEVPLWAAIALLLQLAVSAGKK